MPRRANNTTSRGASFPAREQLPPWHIAIDTGGTFTDCLARDPLGNTRRAKVLSSGTLRATLLDIASPTRLLLQAPWLDYPAFAVGATLTNPNTRAIATITHTEPTGPTNPSGVGVPARLPSAWLTLKTPLTKNLTPSNTLELSTGEEAPILAARLVTGTPAHKPLPPIHLRLATTRGTNALLERRGAPVAFFVTEGFADLLIIGDQTRPDLFTLRVRKPKPLHSRVIEVCERHDAKGEILTPLDLDSLRAHAQKTLDAGVTVAAVALMHAWRNPRHEQLVRNTLLELGFTHVSISSNLGATLGYLARAETAVVNAFLAPVIDDYLDRVQQPLNQHTNQGGGLEAQGGGLSSPRAKHPSLLIMTSAGSLIDRANFTPKDSLLSGPAGGVVGAAAAGRRAGFTRVISFDMGGTSTDCTRCQGPPERIYQTRVGDARIVAPCIAVETVAAGGGSICTLQHSELRVGPESAGADPGPACYGRGGPLTITDCNLLLGRLDPAHFAIPLDQNAAKTKAKEALAQARAQLTTATPASTPEQKLTLETLLAGFLDIANQRMAEAIRRITLRKGHDPAEHALVAFGGAGPQHACAIADALDIDTIIIPPDAGLLSAFGLSVSAIERVAEQQILKPLAEVQHTLTDKLETLTQQACLALNPSGVGVSPAINTRPTVELRYLGQDDIIELDATNTDTLVEQFRDRYHTSFGYTPANTPLELVTARVTATLPSPSGVSVSPATKNTAPTASTPKPPTCNTFTNTWHTAPIHNRATLTPGSPIPGPALLTEPHSTIYLAPGWQARANTQGSLLLSRTPLVVRASSLRAPPQPRRLEACTTTPIEVELAVGKLAAIAEEMGERLRRTAISTNIKQRRDFSCAILDRDGQLIVNAPHIPVHLGSMGVCVRAIRDTLGNDLHHATIVTNHPAYGGSHLPDVTLVQPVHDTGGSLLGYAAARAHHAEIGGIAPGSMAPEATCLEQEGVIIPPTILGREGALDHDLARQLFTTGPHPSRTPETNRRDLAAAAHAVWAGAAGLRTLATTLGHDRFNAIGETIQHRAETRIRAALEHLADGVYTHQQPVIDGGPIAVSIEILGDRATIDFTGSGPVHPRCLNATPAIVTSAVVYVLRLLIDEDLPLNEGLLRPIGLRIPAGMLNPPFETRSTSSSGVDITPASPAVAGGNVEISQLLVETMLTALGLCAQSQSTMNNVVFGNSSFGFYETLGGGAGACKNLQGESAVHTHMTNTTITDPEVLEHRFPVRLEQSALRRGSGGTGTAHGGDGLIRKYRFLTETFVGLLTGSTTPPQGFSGGKDGKPSSAILTTESQSLQRLTTATIRAPANSTLTVQTPGGGGFGETSVVKCDTKAGMLQENPAQSRA